MPLCAFPDSAGSFRPEPEELMTLVTLGGLM